MSTTNFSSSRSHTKSFEELLCSPSSVVGGLQLQQQQLICFSAVDILLPSQYLLGILPFLLPFIRNLPYIRRPNTCIVVWQPLICWLVLLPSLSMVHVECPWFKNTFGGAFVDTQGTQPTSQALYCIQCL